MTFSLVARCAETGMFGVAISSSSPAVAARCSYARAGVGAVATQNVTDPGLGPLALDLMAGGSGAAEAIAEVKKRGEFIEYRQVLAVDRTGATAIHSGPNSLGLWTETQAENVASGGNLLASLDVPQAIIYGFLGASGHIGDRLIAALRAGLAAGGEAGPVHSAGMIDDCRSRCLAGRRLALRLDPKLPDRGDRHRLGRLQAPDGRLPETRARPARRTDLRRAG